MFYLAVPPSLYEVCAEMLGKAGLSKERDTRIGWARIIVEKPFGRDLATAMSLDRTLHDYFKEHQIFRIDHYLAKDNLAFPGGSLAGYSQWVYTAIGDYSAHFPDRFAGMYPYMKSQDWLTSTRRIGMKEVWRTSRGQNTSKQRAVLLHLKLV
jgi:hypothetical protein